MTLAQIRDLWDCALSHAEREVDQAYAHSPHLAREFLERYFFLMRVCVLQAPSAAVHSIGTAGALSAKGFRPWTTPQLERLCQTQFQAGQTHADPPGGDGNLHAWIDTLTTSFPSEKREVIARIRELFGKDATGHDSGLEAILSQDKEEMLEMAKAKGDNSETSWVDEAQSTSTGYFKPSAGRNKLMITDEPAFRDNSFGRRNLEIPTDRGIFATTQRTIVGALVDYTKRHKGKAKGATLVFTSNGLPGTAVRYEKVEVR